MTEIFYLFNSRSLQHSVFRIGVFTNQWVFAGVAVMIVMQLLFTYLPAANRIFQSASISALDWAFNLAFAALVHLLVEVEKTIRRRGRLKKQPS